MWGKQRKRGRGKENDIRTGKYNNSNLRNNRGGKKPQNYFLLHQNSWFASKFYQKPWIRSHSSAHIINCPATLPLEITCGGKKKDTEHKRQPCTQKKKVGGWGQVMLKISSKKETFRKQYECWMFPLTVSSTPNECFEPLVTRVLYLG